ncbi:MAG: hypothetical protein ACLFT4_01915 [Bacteroidales bacterium]
MHREKDTRYTYKTFGLTVESDFEIPELYSSPVSQPDVQIRFGDVPGELNNVEKKGVRFQLNKNEFLLHLDDIAGYYVQNGSAVTIEKSPAATAQEVRLFLLSVVFSALLYQRNIVSLHASAIKKGDSCFLVCGNSGAGKSTLTTEFLNQGYQLLTDDITVLTEKNGEIQVLPSYPFIKLWKDSIEHLNQPEENGFRLREQMEKYGFRLENEFYPEPLPVKSIFILNPHNKPEYSQHELTGVEKFNALRNHTYRFRFILDNVRPVHFQHFNKLAGQASVRQVFRPQAPIDTAKLRQHIEQYL